MRVTSSFSYGTAGLLNKSESVNCDKTTLAATLSSALPAATPAKLSPDFLH